MPTCSQGHPNDEDSMFCGECGEDLRLRCPNGHAIAAGDRFCESCGQPVAAAATTGGGSALSGDQTPLSVSPEPMPAPTGATAPTALPPSPVRMPPPETVPPPPMMPPPGPGVAHYPPTPVVPVAGAAGPPFDGSPPLGGGVRYHFQFKRLTIIDQVTGVASAVLAVALFLPWFAYGSEDGHFSIGGINAHEYLAIAFAISLTLVSYLAIKSGYDRMPVRLPVAHAPLLLVLGILQLLLVLIAFLSRPDSVPHAFGSWLALIAAIAACLPVAIPAAQSFAPTAR